MPSKTVLLRYNRAVDLGRLLINIALLVLIVLVSKNHDSWWTNDHDWFVLGGVVAACAVSLLRSVLTNQCKDGSSLLRVIVILFTLLEAGLLSVVLTMLVKEHLLIEECYEDPSNESCRYVVSRGTYERRC